MKKLVFFFAAVVLTAISANVWAQSTGINPGVGDTKTYSVASHDGSTYSWKLTADVAGVGTDLLDNSLASGTSVTNSIDVTWLNPVVNTIYYLHVTETASVANGGCSNHKVLAIQPKNFFEMDIANVDNAGATIASTYETCAPAVTVASWNDASPTETVEATDAQAFTYNYGTVTFYYKVTATGITNTDWTPVFTISHSSTATVTAEWSKTIGGTYTSGLLTNGSDNTITVTGSNEFFVKVVVANGTVEENLTAKDFTINLDETTSKDEFNNIVTSTNTDTIDQTITARPATGNISY
jgi:hypothetical protein